MITLSLISSSNYSIVTGGVQPAFSIIFSKVINVFALCSIEEQKEKIFLYSMIFIGFGVVSFLSNFLMVFKISFFFFY